MSLIWGIMAVLLTSLTIRPVAAQTGQGTITGQVTDAKGGAVVGAAVKIVSKSTGVQNVTKTNDAGIYNVINLNPDNYNVSITAPGFKDLVTDNVIVSAGATVSVNGALQVGNETQTVTVTADMELLSKTTSDVSTTVDEDIVENLPYPERSALGAVLLVPGVTGDTLNPGGIQPENPNAYTNYFSPGASITVGGAPPGTTALIVDGSDVTEASFPRAGINLSGRLVSEATVVTAGASAQYGRTGGGVIVQASRSGTSQYHGAVTWRHSDPWLNAYPIGLTAPNDVHQTFLGGYLGGPVRIPKLFHGDSKTFFYAAYEPTRLHSLLGFRGLFFSPAQLAGNMHNSLEIMNQTVLKASGWSAALAAPRTGGIGFDAPVGGNAKYPLFPYGAAYASSSSDVQATGPLSDCSIGGTVHQEDLPGAGVCYDDMTALMKQNAFAQYVAGLMPTPSNPGPYIKFDSPDASVSGDLDNASFYRGVVNHDNRWSIRIDHQFSNDDRVYARYTEVPLNAQRFLAVDTSNPLNQVPTDVEMGRDVAIGWTHIVTNNLVNVAHYSWFRENLERLPPLGVATSEDIGAKFGLTPAIEGYGMPLIGGFSSNGANYTIQAGGASGGSRQVDQNFIVGDDIAYTHGTHSMSFGFDYRWLQSNQYDYSGVFGGKYGFSNGNSQAPWSGSNGKVGGGAAWASFIQAISGYSNTPVEVPGYYRYKYWAVYFQDNWRATSKLTLNLGVRYEVQVPRTEAHNRQAFMSAKSIPGTLNGQPVTNAFCFSGSCGLQRSLWPTNYWGIEPRVGLAYAATPKTTVRTSFAITRQPLSGQENIPDPDFNVNGSSAATNTAYQMNYLTNPVNAASLVSAYTQLNGATGPFYFSTGLAPVFVDQTSAVPYTEIWNLSIQHQPFAKTLLMATYQGLNGVHLYGPFVALNTAPLSSVVSAMSTGPLLSAYINGGGYNTYGIMNNNNTSGGVMNETYAQQLEPYQNFYNQSMTRIYPRNGILHYHAMYLSVNQRATKLLTLLANYTWLKSLDDVPDTQGGYGAGSGASSVQNPFDLKSEYSVSTFDQDSKFTAGYNFRAPLGTGQRWKTSNELVNRLIGDLSIGGNATSVVGFPNYVTLGGAGNFYQYVPAKTRGCTATTGYCNTAVLPGGYNLRPNLVKGVPIINKNWKKAPFATNGTTSYFNTNQVTDSAGNVVQIGAFAIPGTPSAPTLGNAPRTLPQARSPREFLMDARAVKGFTIREGYRLNVTMTCMDLLNHPVYYGPSSRTPYSSMSASSTTGLTTYNTNGSFGNLSASNSQGMSRTVSWGAEFVF